MKKFEKNIKYQQLISISSISESNYKEIADLIYETDPYIYPAMFLNRSNATVMIPELIRYNDAI